MNRATHATVATIGVLFALGGMNHGLFEMLQGDVPTGGFLIAAIGPEQRMWVHGEEGAFTIIPSFLWSGVATWVVGLAIIVWSLRFLKTRLGPAVYLLLFTLLFLLGGGVAQVLFFTVAAAAATRIHAPLSWWRRALRPRLRQRLALRWKALLVGTTGLGVLNLWLATTGWLPGVPDDDTVLAIMLVLLLVWYAGFLLTFAAGFAHDIEAKPEPR